MILKSGDLAYFDTFAGLVPVKVLKIVPKPGYVDPNPSTGHLVTFKITATRGAYKKGEELVRDSLSIVPRKSIKVKQGMLKIKFYTVQVD